MNCVALLLCVSVLIVVVHADVYMHHPRGSNNKLSEQSNNVNNETVGVLGCLRDARWLQDNEKGAGVP